MNSTNRKVKGLRKRRRESSSLTDEEEKSGRKKPKFLEEVENSAKFGLDTQHPEKMDVSRSEEEFRAVNHAEKTLHKIEDYWKEKRLCDVILVAGNMRIPAHRFPKKIFPEWLLYLRKGSPANERIENFPVSTFVPYFMGHTIIIFSKHLGVLRLTEDTTENLLGAACLLQLTQVIEVCSKFLIKQLHPSNCLGILSFGDARGCTELLRVAHKYTMEHFIEVIKNEEFLLLPASELCKLLCSDDVNVPDEETIFNAVMQWVDYDVQARQQDLAMLLSYIRLPLLPPQLLVDLEVRPVFTADLECQKLLIEAMKYHLLPERRHMLQSPRTKPRKSTVGALYAVGGMDAKRGTPTVEKYDIRTNSWQHCSTMSNLRVQFGVAVIDNKLYVLGGGNDFKTLNIVECFDPATKIWTAMPPMSTARYALGVATLEGPMYAVGGHDGSNILNSVERWDPEEREWTYVASMSSPRSRVSVVALNGKYDSKTDLWSALAPLSVPREAVALCPLGDRLYVVGGYDGQSYLNTVESYDAQTDEWREVFTEFAEVFEEYITFYTRNKECAHLLLAHNAPVKVKNAQGWSLLAEAISYGDRQMIIALLRKLKQQSRESVGEKRPRLLKALKELGDFYQELHWDFQSWVPLLSRILPSDACKIYKQGINIRLDTTLIDFTDMKCQRGDLSFIFNGDAAPSESFVVLDNEQKVYQRIHHEESEMETEEVDILMSSDIYSATLSTKSISFTRAQTGWLFREDKTERVGNFLADFYLVNGLVLESRKRREHLSEEDILRNKAIMESLSKGGNIMEQNFEPVRR
ncbi:Kelch-Like Protein 4 [Manis pentadactyla]|nr:Kelch-Like Protein 4 [Manis pentadactyla]